MPNLHIHKVLSKPESAKKFTIIDLGFAYHQICLTDKSKDITVFTTTERLFSFTGIPFGLSSSSLISYPQHCYFAIL